MCGIVDDLVIGAKFTKVILSLPPGHGKSETITRRLPIYWGLRRPSSVALLTGYNQTFAEKQLSKPCRDIAEELGLVSDDATAMEEWHLSNGGRIVARGVGSAPTGVNPIELIICDDPIKDQKDAQSETVRDGLKDWWKGSIRQRFWDDQEISVKTRALVIATRWHEDDLSGYLLSQEKGWHHVNLPALAEENDPMGRMPGEPLWPEAKGKSFLLSEQAENPFWFQSTYQGKPTAKEGNTFKVANFRYVNPLEVDKSKIRSIYLHFDLAATQGGGDYTAGVVMGLTEDDTIIILDVLRGQWGSEIRNREMMRFASPWKETATIQIAQEGGSAGVDQKKALTKLFMGYDLDVIKETGSKEIRAEAYSSQVNLQNVLLVKAEWNADFVEEHRQFPNGKHDDQIDAAANAFNSVALSESLQFDDIMSLYP
jgi:predicted phage terminase large subunit-like protein